MYINRNKLAQCAMIIVMAMIATTVAAISPTTKGNNVKAGNTATAGVVNDIMINQKDIVVIPSETTETGLAPEEEVVEENPYIDYEEPVTKYVSAETLNTRSSADATDDSNIISVLKYNDTIEVKGEVRDSDWVYSQFGDITFFVNGKYLSDEKLPEIVVKKTKAEKSSNGETTAATTKSAPIQYTSAGHLTRSAGVYYGPSGKETYYNLPMGGVIKYMKQEGYDMEYWVRDDGVKMYGDYVMIAADLSIRPKGTLVETSLGTGIVCDTGTFVYSGDSTWIDIAVAW